MIAFVIECTVGYNDVCRISFRLVSSWLLRTDHYQRQLACRLPNFVFLNDFFSVGWYVLCASMVS